MLYVRGFQFFKSINSNRLNNRWILLRLRCVTLGFLLLFEKIYIFVDFR